MVSYLSKFLPTISKETAPLRELDKKEHCWHWNSCHEQAFEKIKSMICQSPVLKYFDHTQQITLQCDASQGGLGAALLQEGRPVAYASRALTETEKNYAQIEKELLAIVFACFRFEQYVFGKRI